MKQNTTRLLQAIIVLIGIGAVTFLLGEPHLEGRNENATVFEIYFKDPFLAYVYLGSIPFFVALIQAFKWLGAVGRNEGASPRAVKALQTIKQCGIAMFLFVVGAVIWILRAESDDHAGGVAMGVMAALIALAITATAAVFERRCSQ